MAPTINWLTKVISVPQTDLTLLSGVLFELDTNQLRLDLKALEASVVGMAELDTHRHNTEVTISGFIYARTFEIINGYTITFTPDAAYRVNFANSNNNISDVLNLNTVQTASQNSAGLIRDNPSGVKINVALPHWHVTMFDVNNPQTPIAGRTVSGFSSRDSEAGFTALTNPVLERASGSYYVSGGLTAAELNGQIVSLLFTATGAESRIVTIVTVAE